MTQNEFTTLTGIKVSDLYYKLVVEPAYMACPDTKQKFCASWKRNGGANEAIAWELHRIDYLTDNEGFNDGYATVKRGGKYNLIDKHGCLVLKKWCDDLIHDKRYVEVRNDGEFHKAEIGHGKLAWVIPQ